jgi:hypothetical protein
MPGRRPQLSSFVRWVGDVALPRCGRCRDARRWWAPVEQRLREVAVVVGRWLLRMVVVVENENVVC